MRDQILKTAGAALVSVAAISLLSIHAQENRQNTGSSSLTTNWLGSVVVGKVDSADAIAQGPYPQCAQEFQLGLRSDGVVVWRRAK
jgi:RNA polymerase subunit RPABC4/transcription elongation factor Spt4